MDHITLTLPASHVALIVEALGLLPYGKVLPVMQAIGRQLDRPKPPEVQGASDGGEG